MRERLVWLRPLIQLRRSADTSNGWAGMLTGGKECWAVLPVSVHIYGAMPVAKITQPPGLVMLWWPCWVLVLLLVLSRKMGSEWGFYRYGRRVGRTPGGLKGNTHWIILHVPGASQYLQSDLSMWISRCELCILLLLGNDTGIPILEV